MKNVDGVLAYKNGPGINAPGNEEEKLFLIDELMAACRASKMEVLNIINKKKD